MFYISTGWTIGVLGFDSRRGLGIFLFTTVSRTALGPTQPPIQWVPGALFMGVKRPRREAHHSCPPSAEVKNAWSYTSTPQYVFVAWCLVKRRDNFLPLPAALHLCPWSVPVAVQSGASAITMNTVSDPSLCICRLLVSNFICLSVDLRPLLLQLRNPIVCLKKNIKISTTEETKFRIGLQHE
jgi:hypothetical protein